MFTKGKSGNPSGRPKRLLVTSHIERELLSQANETDDALGTTKARKIAEKVVEMALAGNPWAVQFVTERTEGKPDQHVTISGEVHALTDDELNDIAAGSRDRTAQAQDGAQKPSSVH